MKSFGNLSRYIKYLDSSPYFYTYIMLFSLAVFGIFGIVPMTSSVVKKSVLLSNMHKILKSLDTKEASLVVASKELDSIFPYTKYLDAYMPAEANVEDYLVILAAKAVKNGFSIKRLAPSVENDSKVLNLQVSIEGYGDVVDLIKDIEGMERVTKINTVTISEVKGRDRLDLELQIFSR